MTKVGVLERKLGNDELNPKGLSEISDTSGPTFSSLLKGTQKSIRKFRRLKQEAMLKPLHVAITISWTGPLGLYVSRETTVYITKACFRDFCLHMTNGRRRGPGMILVFA